MDGCYEIHCVSLPNYTASTSTVRGPFGRSVGRSSVVLLMGIPSDAFVIQSPPIHPPIIVWVARQFCISASPRELQRNGTHSFNHLNSPNRGDTPS